MSLTFNSDRADVCDTEAVTGSINVTTTPVEARVGSSPLSGRQLLLIQPTDNNVFLGYSASFTTTQGLRLFQNQVTALAVGPTINVWLRTSSGTVAVKIQELA